MTGKQLLEVADGDDNVAESLVGMYDVSQVLAERIVAVAEPYARIATILVDRAFLNLVRAHKTPKGTVMTPETIKMLGDLFDHVLFMALDQEDNTAYVNKGLVVLGSSMDQFPQGLNYWRVIPAMRMLLPRLIEIQLENCDKAAAE
jgi:hypothetical protein